MTHDLSICCDEGRFSLRAAALILQDNCLVAVRDKAHHSFYTIGGRVHLGESTEQAALREAREETGCTHTIDRLLFVQERFFSFSGMQQHEVCFYYLMQPAKDTVVPGMHTDQSSETLALLPLDDLDCISLVPHELKDMLRLMPRTPQHIITYE